MLNNISPLPGWNLKVLEISPGAYTITLTDIDGRKAEITDHYNEASLNRCLDYAFDIERQTARDWNKFLYDLVIDRLADATIDNMDYHPADFGSWIIQIRDKRLLLDGKDGCLIYQEKQNDVWVDEASMLNFRHVTFEQLVELLVLGRAK